MDMNGKGIWPLALHGGAAVETMEAGVVNNLVPENSYIGQLRSALAQPVLCFRTEICLFFNPWRKDHSRPDTIQHCCLFQIHGCTAQLLLLVHIESSN